MSAVAGLDGASGEEKDGGDEGGEEQSREYAGFHLSSFWTASEKKRGYPVKAAVSDAGSPCARPFKDRNAFVLLL
jgi:hypothetical protein